jgi:hypothetical protein
MKLTSPTVPSHICCLAININRINSLKKYGFTEQNNIASYRRKISENKPAQTMHKAKALAKNASLFLDRCVGLA